MVRNVEFDDFHHSVNNRNEFIFCYPEVVREISRFHENSGIASIDKASDN